MGGDGIIPTIGDAEGVGENSPPDGSAKMPTGTWAGVNCASPVRLLSIDAVERVTGGVNTVDCVTTSKTVDDFVTTAAQHELFDGPRHVVIVLVVSSKHGAVARPPAMDLGSSESTLYCRHSARS